MLSLIGDVNRPLEGASSVRLIFERRDIVCPLRCVSENNLSCGLLAGPISSFSEIFSSNFRTFFVTVSPNLGQSSQRPFRTRSSN